MSKIFVRLLHIFSKVIRSMVIVMVFPGIRGPKQYLVVQALLLSVRSEWIRRAEEWKAAGRKEL